MATRQQIVQKARSEIGYSNSGNRYGAGNWCAHFVSYVFDAADGVRDGNLGGYFNASGRTDYIERDFRNAGRFISAPSRVGKTNYVAPNGRSPQAGDVIFFDGNTGGVRGTPPNQSSDHIGIVTDVRNGRVYYIDGNNPSGRVRESSYSLSEDYILGYGLLDTGVSIQPDSRENNNSISQATWIKTGVSQGKNVKLLGMNIHNSSDVDYYRITLDSTGTNSNFVKIDFKHSEGDIDLQLLNSSGGVVRTSSGSGNSESISLNNLASGTYYAKVYGYRGATNRDYSISWDTSTNHADRYEYNDTIANATHISGGTTGGKSVSLLDLSIHNSNDVDYFKIVLDEIGTSDNFVKTSFTGSKGDLDLALVNAAGNTVRSSSGSGNTENISLNGLASGTYYAKVYGYRGATNDYSISWNTTTSQREYESNNTRYLADTLRGTNGTLKGSIAWSGDEDWFKFNLNGTGTSGSKIELGASSKTSQRIVLYDAFGNKLTGSMLKSIPLAGRAAGTYYVKAYDVVGLATGDYTLSWNTASNSRAATSTASRSAAPTTQSLTSDSDVMFNNGAGAFASYLNSSGTAAQTASQNSSDALRKYGTLVQA